MSTRHTKRKREVHSHSPSPSPSTEDHDSSYSPAAGPPTKATRSSNGKMLSREQLRKVNHSLIEKRRREKMNAALGELRIMVPGLSGASAGEFKLEVLERTVTYMRGLLHRIQELESDLGAVRTEASDSGRNKRKRKREAASGTVHIDTQSPPSPSLSPPGTDAPRITHKERTRHYPVKGRDPDETESDPGMRGAMERSVSGTSSTHSPPVRTRPHPPYPMFAHNPPLPSQPLPPPARAVNPHIHLPFPTPSPTSPFLSYHPSSRPAASGPSSSSAFSFTTSSTGPPEPSPFLAPLPHIPLFGGALNLEATPAMPATDAKRETDPNMQAEEAANLLLAFSSPDTLRPLTGPGQGFSTIQSQTSVEGRKRSEGSGSDEWSLDGPAPERVSVNLGTVASMSLMGASVVGKTARDILMIWTSNFPSKIIPANSPVRRRFARGRTFA